MLRKDLEETTEGYYSGKLFLNSWGCSLMGKECKWGFDDDDGDGGYEKVITTCSYADEKSDSVGEVEQHV